MTKSKSFINHSICNEVLKMFSDKEKQSFEIYSLTGFNCYIKCLTQRKNFFKQDARHSKNKEEPIPYLESKISNARDIWDFIFTSTDPETKEYSKNWLCMQYKNLDKDLNVSFPEILNEFISFCIEEVERNERSKESILYFIELLEQFIAQ